MIEPLDPDMLKIFSVRDEAITWSVESTWLESVVDQKGGATELKEIVRSRVQQIQVLLRKICLNVLLS